MSNCNSINRQFLIQRKQRPFFLNQCIFELITVSWHKRRRRTCQRFFRIDCVLRVLWITWFKQVRIQSHRDIRLSRVYFICAIYKILWYTLIRRLSEKVRKQNQRLNTLLFFLILLDLICVALSQWSGVKSQIKSWDALTRCLAQGVALEGVWGGSKRVGARLRGQHPPPSS